jgi:sterol desaturase/sphingolipid hydroxylase (fatty acid hydroxylase superfamily)
MVMDCVQRMAHQILGTLSVVTPGAIACATVMLVLGRFSSQACNPGRIWWRNSGLLTDACYFIVVPFIAPYMRAALLIAGATVLAWVMKGQDVSDFLQHGGGPLSGLLFWQQVAIYIVASDFMLYWAHRIFHGRTLWHYHAIHHSAKDVDWTTAYRFHPINLWFGTFLIITIMLFAGISSTVVLFLVPFETAAAFFVHANLNWTLGPLRYIVASPVFHRWHHTSPSEGGNSNFAPLLPLWDVLFGTFYMPQGKLPAHYGVDDPMFPQGFLGQLVYPFRRLLDVGTLREEAVRSVPSTRSD